MRPSQLGREESGRIPSWHSNKAEYIGADQNDVRISFRTRLKLLAVGLPQPGLPTNFHATDLPAIVALLKMNGIIDLRE